VLQDDEDCLYKSQVVFKVLVVPEVQVVPEGSLIVSGLFGLFFTAENKINTGDLAEYFLPT